MASTPVKRNGKWYISVCIDGQRKAARRQTKAECVLWAADIEKKLRHGKNIDIVHKIIRRPVTQLRETGITKKA